MKVLDYEPQWWFLLEDGGSLFLDANCNHSFLGYDFMIQLNPQEVAEYRNNGRAFLYQLARGIQDTVPILEESTSIYKGRDVSKAYSEQVTAAVRAWRAKGDHA